jgi:hypothetical protein
MWCWWAGTLNKRGRLSRDIVTQTVPALLMLMSAVAVYVGVSRGLGPLRELAHAVANRSHLDLARSHRKRAGRGPAPGAGSQ